MKFAQSRLFIYLTIAKSRFKIKKRYIYGSVLFIIILYISGIFAHLLEKDYYTEFKYPYDGNIEKSVQQLRENKKPDISPINEYNYKFIKTCKEKCKSDIDKKRLRLIYLIKSAPSNFDRRLSIRSSWGFEKRFSDVEIRTVFLLGTTPNVITQDSINEEFQRFKDIVQADFVDSYFNNTIKTMMGFKWAVTYCNTSKFYMFVDDDYYVSTKNVLRYVRNPTNYPQYLEEPLFSLQSKKLPFNRKKRQIIDFELPEDVQLYSGYIIVSAPLRHITSKWYISLEEYPYNMWPPYVTAGAYVLSREALIKMYFTSFYTKHFRFDDIYLALVSKKANIEPFHCEEFYFHKKKYIPKEYQYTIASHGFGDPEELLHIWTEQRSLGNA